MEVSKLTEISNLVLEAVELASDIVMEIYNSGDLRVEDKYDGSPVTIADKKCHEILFNSLKSIDANIPILSEEGDTEENKEDLFWLIDPLDGTKEFINRRTDFTVNIGLIRDRRPVLGVVLTPYDGRLWAGSETMGAFTADSEGSREVISTRKPNEEKLTVVASRSHRSPELEDYIEKLNVGKAVSRGSSLKFCLLASGQADIYPRLGPTMEWDTAAGHAVLLAAGGRLTNFNGTPFEYGKPEFKNDWFIAYGY